MAFKADQNGDVERVERRLFNGFFFVFLGFTLILASPTEIEGREVTDRILNRIGGPHSETTIVYVESSGLCGGYSPCYTTIQEAVDASSNKTTMKIAQGNYDENIIFNSATESIIIQGGWDESFSSQSSNTYVNSLTIFYNNSGLIEVDKIVLQNADTDYPPDVTGLRMWDKAEGDSDWEGTDLILTWNTITQYPSLNGYKVRVYQSDEKTPRRDEEHESNTVYTYTHQDNLEDAARLGESEPATKLHVKVWGCKKNGLKSQVPATITVNSVWRTFYK